MRVGAVVLCGGKSSRMTLPKETLPFGDEVMLQRVVRICTSVVQPVVVVAAPDQELPELPELVIVARDDREGRGPLEGLAAGLSAIKNDVDAVFATSCDVPFLQPSFIQLLVDQLGENDIVVPFDDRYHHPLAALYRTRVLPAIQELLAADRMRPLFLFDTVTTLRVPTSEMQEVDSDLQSLRNLNRPVDYFAAAASAGFEIPPAVRATLEKVEED